MTDQEAPDGRGYSESTKLVPSGRPGTFAKGHDPRRQPGGISKEILEARRELQVHLPTAIKLLVDLMASPDDKIRLAAACEVMDRTIGKPRMIDPELSEVVKVQMSAILAKMRISLEPELYLQLVAEVMGT